ncbi:MAG: hypothetical protein H7246_21285 [Phycisphaerae bacterium]|nr:hypothetical protein [Saprospiraceae bacterium]
MKQIAFRYGLWMFFSLTGFFLLMHILHLSENFYLRIFNGAIHLGVLWIALRAWTRGHHEGTSDITAGVGVGMFTSFIGVVPFAFFMAIFLNFNPEFLASIQRQTSMGVYLNPITSCFFIVVEAIVMSLIGSYIMLRILNSKRERASENSEGAA